MTRTVTLRDVAKAAGVSVATVSRAMNKHGRMSDATRERVLATAKQLGFRPNAIAQSLITKRSGTVGFLNNDLSGRFTLPVMTGVVEAMFDAGVSVFLCSIEDDAELATQNLEAMLAKRVDGLIAAGKRIDKRLPIDVSTSGLPTIFVSADPEPETVCFAPDDELGAYKATAHLIELGRRRIAHVTGPLNFRAAQDRAAGYQRALEAHGLKPAPENTIFAEWSERAGHEAVRVLFDDSALAPDALFCGNDQIARGVVDALSARQMKIPSQVAVVGFDNWEIIAAASRPALTTMDMQLTTLGNKAGQTLLKMIAGQPIEKGIHKLPCRLILRDSA